MCQVSHMCLGCFGVQTSGAFTGGEKLEQVVKGLQ